VTPALEVVVMLIERGALAAAYVAIWFLWRDNKAIRRQLDELNEKRVEEAKAVSETVIATAREIDRAVDRLGSSVDTLIELQRGGRR